MRLEGPGTATLIADDLQARRDRWSEAVVGAEPRQVRASPVERSAVGEVPAEAAARVSERPKERKDRREKEPAPKVAGRELSAEEQREVARLAELDRRVKAREQAYVAASSGQARGSTIRYLTGPDGKRYAVSADLQIDTSPVEGNPELTLAKAEAIEAAALASADPTPQDRMVAAQARRMAAEARQKLQRQQASKAEGQADPSEPSGPSSERAARFDPRVRAYTREQQPRSESRLSLVV